MGFVQEPSLLEDSEDVLSLVRCTMTHATDNPVDEVRRCAQRTFEHLLSQSQVGTSTAWHIHSS